jgi:hypothetical protein
VETPIVGLVAVGWVAAVAGVAGAIAGTEGVSSTVPAGATVTPEVCFPGCADGTELQPATAATTSVIVADAPTRRLTP